jgi:hypothetical protein
MRIPSFSYVEQQLKATGKRFTLPLLFAITGTLASIINMSRIHAGPHLIRLTLTCLLGLSFGLAMRLYSEQRHNRTMRLLLDLAVVVIMGVYYLLLAPSELFEQVRLDICFWVLMLVAHLMVSVAAWLHSTDIKGFWWFNEALFIRIIISGIFSGSLFAGLALAMEACRELFTIQFSNDYFGYLGLIIFGVFNTWFFLAGIPGSGAANEELGTFPKPLKIFVQYVLIPLVLLYMLILYLYMGRISMEWNLPHGWVSLLILCYSVAGILAVLLSHPLRNDAHNTWVHLFSRFFFKATLPVLLLLYAAIYRRIADYGFTEDRYYVLAAALWLTGICLYFSFSGSRNIKVIPVSLAVTCLLSLTGPWGAFAVSDRSQLARYAVAGNRIKTGKVTKHKTTPTGNAVTETISAYDNNESQLNVEQETMADIIYFFTVRSNEQQLQPFFKANIAVLSDTLTARHKRQPTDGYYDGWLLRNSMADTLKELAGVAYQIRHNDIRHIRMNDFYIRNISGYNFMSGIDWSQWKDSRLVLRIDPNDSLVVTFHGKDSVWIQLERSGNALPPINMHKWLAAAHQMEENTPATQRQMQTMNADSSVCILATNIYTYKSPMKDTTQRELSSMEGYILIR